MALNIKDEETDRLARELAQLKGTSITDALKSALTHELAGLRRPSPAEVERRRVALQAIVERGRSRAVDYDLTEDEILGYDESGLPL